jgi:hypothetical protein
LKHSAFFPQFKIAGGEWNIGNDARILSTAGTVTKNLNKTYKKTAWINQAASGQ